MAVPPADGPRQPTTGARVIGAATITALRSICRRIRSLLGRDRVVERPPAPPLTESQDCLSLVGHGEASWPVEIDPTELDLVGTLVGVEGWQRLRQFEALEKALPHLGAEPEPLPEHPLDRLDLHAAIVRLGWNSAPQAGCHGADGEEI